ncbi:serine/threonine protein kinase [Myxococcus xanthus]|uniref:serine/threonine protein kinase n=1 Tax=Myxococcus xanthus TaxID=34 RepID=UPI0013758660|nr:serine/threonine-protein kinase [Myxococcus xanthus]
MDIRPGAVLEGPDGKLVKIEAILGQGGFGQVFAGRLPDGTQVAVKTLLTAALRDDELRVLQNEVKHAVGIEHPNVIRLLYVNDGGSSGGRPPYFIMEYIEGGSLRTMLERHQESGSRFTIDELRALYLQIAEGMCAVNKRVVHRDLKPENVLVAAGEAQLKIADFGLAKLAGAATRSASFKGWGTPPYQAPEAFEDGPNTPAMDVYAAGVMFFELATLEWPIEPKSGDRGPLAWRNAHLLTAPKDIRKLRPEMPHELVQLIAQMMQKDPARRPPSWLDVKERLIGGRHVSGGPDVSALLSKVTSTYIQATEREARAREAAERSKERQALLEQAFGEPVEILRGLVDALNNVTSVGKLTLRVLGPLHVEVKPQSGHVRLILEGQIIDDLDTKSSNGVARVIGSARLDPTPSVKNREEIYRNQDSFGSFSLVYFVSSASERFGRWTQIRFEINPLMREVSYPRWFAVDFRDLSHQLKVLNAMGRYQHERCPVSDEWFKALLIQIL